MEEKETLSVRIMNPDAVIWEGEAESVSSENIEGPFDILPGHANFLTLITGKPVVVRRHDGDREFVFRQALLYTHDDSVAVYTNIEEASSIKRDTGEAG